jgi:hypothetical protein
MNAILKIINIPPVNVNPFGVKCRYFSMGRLFSPKYVINPSYGLSNFDGNFVPLYFDLFGLFFAIVIGME